MGTTWRVFHSGGVGPGGCRRASSPRSPPTSSAGRASAPTASSRGSTSARRHAHARERRDDRPADGLRSLARGHRRCVLAARRRAPWRRGGTPTSRDRHALGARRAPVPSPIPRDRLVFDPEYRLARVPRRCDARPRRHREDVVGAAGCDVAGQRCGRSVPAHRGRWRHGRGTRRPPRPRRGSRRSRDHRARRAGHRDVGLEPPSLDERRRRARPPPHRPGHRLPGAAHAGDGLRRRSDRGRDRGEGACACVPPS